MTRRFIPPQEATVVEGSQFEHSLVIKDPEGIRGTSLDDRFYKIGRSPKSDICVHSQLVSREHATLKGILTDPPLFQIFRLSDGNPENRKSTNGIKINGEERDNWVLMHGDEIVFSSDSIAHYRIDPEPPYANGRIDIFLDCLKHLAKTYLKSVNYINIAKATLQQILVLTKKSYGEVHPDVANCLIDLALLHYSQNDFVNGETLFLQAIAIRKQALGEEHTDVVSAMLDLSAIYNSQALYMKAEKLFLEALEIKKNVLGHEHPEIAASFVDLATMYYPQKRYREVKNLYENALKIYKQSLKDKHPNILSVQTKLDSINKKLRPKWLSLNILIPASLVLISGVITYIFFAPKTDITCVKILTNGSVKSILGEKCRQISK